MIFISAGETRNALSRAADEIEGAIQGAFLHTADMASVYARQSTIYKSHTYGLRSSISRGELFATADGFGARVQAHAPYAGFVEGGTRARFSRVVRHPGTRPRPFMAQARDRAEPLLEQNISNAIGRTFGA